MPRHFTEQAYEDLYSRLRARRTEIEQAILSRVLAMSESSGELDPEYAEGLRTAVSAAIEYGLAAVELGEEGSPPPPPALLAQARVSARNGYSLDTVLRRYFAGHALLADFIVEEAERGGVLRGGDLQRLLRIQATLFDRVIAAVSEEHNRESRGRPSSTEERRAWRIERLLAGEFLDTSQLGYDFESHHIGVIASGSGAPRAIRSFAGALDSRLLAIERGEDTAWAWLGGRRAFDTAELQVHAAALPPQIVLATGEPAEGLEGWRLTHRQARAALPIAQRGPKRIVRYGEVALLASALHDELLTRSLHQLYLGPLEAERDGGAVARETLRAYFAAEHNVTSTAAALGVSRQAVTNRLRAIEEALGQPLVRCTAELETALCLETLRPLSIS